MGDQAVASAEPVNESATRSVDELWLDVLQQVSARTSHELKGALNGVAVNLEVVRSRSAKPDAAAVAVAPFAASAGDQLDAVVGMTEALLKLARPPREPVDIRETLDSLGSPGAPSARADGGSLRIESQDRKSTRLNSSHIPLSRMPSS